MRASYIILALAVVAMAGVGCGGGTSAVDGGGGSGADAPAGTGGTAGGGAGGGGGNAGTGGMGGTGGSNILDCYSGSATDTCTPAERATLNQCHTTMCSSAYSACYGPQARMGVYAGRCQAFIQCLSNCGCGNVLCSLGCVGMNTSDCMACQTAIQTCQDTSMCAVPACAIRPDGGLPGLGDGGLPGLGDGGLPGLGDGGLPGLGDGGFPGLGDGGFPGLGDAGGGATCANLLTCCAAIAAPATKTQCMQEYAVSAALGDAVCGVIYQRHKTAGDCP